MEKEEKDLDGQDEGQEGSEDKSGNAGSSDPKDSGTDNKGEELTDKHGQDAISKGKYDRDMSAKDTKIAELEDKISDMSKTEKGRADLKKQLDEVKASQSEMRTEYELKLAGCKDDKAVKAAKALLDDYEGDVSKLKTECPYLFAEDKKTGSTGKKSEGAADSDIDAKLDKAFGLK